MIAKTSSNNSTSGNVTNCSTEQEYYDIIQAAGEKLVVVDCFATWCPPCQKIAPVFQAISEEYSDVVFVKVDVDKVPRIKSILGVYAMPTFAFVKEGNKVGSFMGAKEESLRRGLDNDGIVGVCSSCIIQ